MLQQRARQMPEAPALVTPDRIISFAEYERMIREIADRLQEMDLGPGKRLAIWCRNRWELVVLLMACWYREILTAPLNPKLPIENLRMHLATVQAHALIVEAELASALPPDWTIPLMELESLFASRKQPIVEGAWHHPDPELTLIFTSGTTGEPRAACHTWANHYYNARGANQNIPFKVGDRWLLSLPLFHVGGLAIIFRALLGGGAIVIPENRAITPEIIERHQITHLSVVATQLQRFLQEIPGPGYRSSLKCILTGGGPIPPHLIQQALDLRPPLFTTYGSTEMGSQITTTRPGDTLQQLLTAGKPLPYREVHIAADGEILVKGPTLFKGYWKEGQLDRPVDELGWFHTGDIGRWTIDGYLKVVGRKDNMFISGGENIQPEEIEAMLLRLPGVKQALVVPVPHAEYGQRPVAFLEMNEDAPELDADRMRQLLRAFLPGFKIPDHFFPWPEKTEYMIKPNRKVFQKIAEERLAEGD
ncbi:MAG: o-succinylbenzoate--CoA ligase [Calditrichaeota bacterium]|nr:o-succinylbenzoate--CoA ligase [Calditrichota bacterium]